jgi:hypothetical protein
LALYESAHGYPPLRLCTAAEGSGRGNRDRAIVTGPDTRLRVVRGR